MEYAANVLASWVFKIKGDSASKECTGFLVQQRRAGAADIADYEFTTSLSFPWGVSRRPVRDVQRATVLMPRSPAGSLWVLPRPSPLQPDLPTVRLCGVNSSSRAHESQFLSEVRVVSLSLPEHGWEETSASVKAATSGGGWGADGFCSDNQSGQH